MYDELYPIKKCIFENLNLYIPNNYDNYFKRCNFGDYMNEIKIFCHNEELNKELINFPVELYRNNINLFLEN